MTKCVKPKYASLTDLQADVHAPGVYVGMPDDEYHADPSVGSSLINNQHISPLTAYEASPLNAHYEWNDDTPITRFGRIAHLFLLEGKEALFSQFALPHLPADYPEALVTKEDLITYAETKEIPVDVRGKKQNIIDTLIAYDPTLKDFIWDVMRTQWEAENAGKKPIQPDEVEYLMQLRAAAAKDPTAVQILACDAPREVAIFWEDPETGLPCKAKPDMLWFMELIDLKSFAPWGKSPIGGAVLRAVREQNYHRQAVHYRNGLLAACAMQDEFWHGVEREFVTEMKRRYAADRTVDNTWLFAGRTLPNIRVLTFPIGDEQKAAAGAPLHVLAEKGQWEVQSALRSIAHWMSKCGTDVWWDQAGRQKIDEDDLPPWWRDEWSTAEGDPGQTSEVISQGSE